jgi:hypothetical protein
LDAQPLVHPPRRTLREYAIGELDDDAARIVREHVETCADCRRRLAADGVTIDSSPGPCMSATGKVDAGAAGLNGLNEPILRSGTLIGYFGDYELENILGKGGMGPVYKARQHSLNRLVALKMIKSAGFASADELRRLGDYR